MIQVATFLMPEEQALANEFLKTHKPEGQIHFNKDTIVVFYDDGTYPAEYQIADLQEMLLSNRKAKLQMEIALHVMKSERADLNPKQNAGKYEEISNAINQTADAIATQDIKAAFAEQRIEELRATIANG